MGCRKACEQGKACEGGGGACAAKSSAGASGAAPCHPAVARARTITGTHPAYPAKSSAGIADLTSENDARGYYPSNAELAALGIDRATWDSMGGADRLRLARGGSTGSTGSTDATQRAREAALSGDQRAFQEALSQVPVDQRAGLLREYLRAQGASEEAVRAGLLRLAEQGLNGLSTWLNSDLQRDLERIRAGAATDQERIRQQQETTREEIRAETERYRIDHARGGSTGSPQSSGTGGTVLLGVGVLGLLVLAGVALTRKGAQ